MGRSLVGNDSRQVSLEDSELGDSGERWHQFMQGLVELDREFGLFISTLGDIMVYGY